MELAFQVVLKYFSLNKYSHTKYGWKFKLYLVLQNQFWREIQIVSMKWTEVISGCKFKLYSVLQNQFWREIQIVSMK